MRSAIYQNVTYQKVCFTIIFILLFSAVPGVIGHGDSIVESTYDGPRLLIPMINESPIIDGVALESEFPEQGHLELSGFLDEVKISHNNTALFIAITVDAEEFVGFGAMNSGSHDQTEANFVYFLVGIISDQTNQAIRTSESDYSNPETVNKSDTKFIANVTEEGDERVYELMISIRQGDTGDEFSIEDPIHGIVPRIGAIFNLMILNGEGEDITSTDVSKSAIVPAYLLRDGEDASEIQELLENNPSWFEILVFPLILFSLSVYFVWKYKLVVIKNGGN